LAKSGALEPQKSIKDYSLARKELLHYKDYGFNAGCVQRLGYTTFPPYIALEFTAFVIMTNELELFFKNC